MNVLGIMGSPRINGNTDILIDAALKGAQSTGCTVEKIVVDDLDIAPCREYYNCLIDGTCYIKDDMELIYPKLLNNKYIIVASPIFFYGLTSQLKALIDRSQAIWAQRHILKWKIPSEGRKGIFIGVGATKGNNLFEGSVLTIRYFFKTIGVEYSGELLVRNVDRKGEILEKSQTIVDAFELGKNLVQNINK